MKKTSIISFMLLMALSIFSFKPMGKLVSQKTSITFFSHTSVEDIAAKNLKSTSTLDTETGEVVFVVPMQGFEFEKSLMQKHYNSPKFLDTKKYSKGKLIGKITNLNEINFSKDGTYNAKITGELTIKETTKTINEKGTITVKGKSVQVNSKFSVVLAEYGVEFEKGKPAKNIAKTVEITVDAQY